ncbi:MAG: V-type ATPase subunit, partial [Ruminococcus sp.]|nr:V-type ATPase subunit [Ruminococcus sp.]
MSKTEYASAVAAIKAMECTLLSHNDIEQLINTPTLNELKTLLESKAASNDMNEVWNMLSTYAPDCEELKILLYRNDFHNLKSVL